MTRSGLVSPLAACAVSLACAAGGGPASAGAASPEAPSRTGSPAEPPAWESPLARDHPLAGRIYDVGAGRFVSEPELLAQLAGRRFVLLGEKHDNPDHHRLQARVLRELVEAGRHPGVAFEMLGVQVEPALERFRDRSPPSLAAIREAAHWDESGWPEWRLYAPIFRVALEAQLPIAAADLSDGQVRAIRDGGLDALDPELRARLGLDEPPPPGRRRALAAAIREGHCGYLPERGLDRMMAVQRARDAHLARSLVDLARTPRTGGAVLIAGAEHVRRDRAAPVHLEQWAAAGSIASLAFLEVRDEHTDPALDLAGRFGPRVPFDFVWFTPRLDDEDPCETFRPQLEELHEEMKADE